MDDLDVWTIARSHLDARVWVPYDHEGDQSCFLHAGSLRAVKAWVTTQIAGDFHWVKSDADTWFLMRGKLGEPEPGERDATPARAHNDGRPPAGANTVHMLTTRTHSPGCVLPPGHTGFCFDDVAE